MRLTRSLLAFAVCLSFAALAKDPAPTPAERAAAFDRDFFSAFNTCDLKTLAALTAPDLEFFHDLNGILRGRDAFIASVEKNVCRKFSREPVAGTQEAWPLGKDGLIYSGTHRFCSASNAATKGCQGSGRYLHVLMEREGKLIISRVVSYDHRALETTGSKGAASSR